MTLKFRCKDCNKYNKIKGTFTDRRDLANEKGELFELKCLDCEGINQIRPNHVTAVENKFLGLLLPVLFAPAILFCYFIFNNFLHRDSTSLRLIALGFALLIPLKIYLALSNAEKNKVRNFNRYKL